MEMREAGVFAVYGDGRPNYVAGNTEYSEFDEKFPIARDEREMAWSARDAVPERLRELSFKICSRSKVNQSSDRRKIASDALLIARGGVDPKCELAGISTAVSERARDVLAPEVGAECAFVEVDIGGLVGKWYVLWVRQIIDPVDRDGSVLRVSRWGDSGEAIFRPNRLEFCYSKISAQYLFRLPQWIYEWDHDLCLDTFVSLVSRNKLKGFHWMSRGGTGPFVEVGTTPEG